MKITFREITPDNFRECINLKVSKDQEKFVATNVYSIAQSKVYPTALPFAIYAENKMVGFVRYGFNAEENRFYLGRLMIDEKEQGRGYGKAATLEVIERLKKIEDCKAVYLFCSLENINAEKLYSKIGFKRTEEIIDGEVLMRYDLQKSNTTND